MLCATKKVKSCQVNEDTKEDINHCGTQFNSLLFTCEQGRSLESI